MAWCCQATSHYLIRCWIKSKSLAAVTRPQQVYVHMGQVTKLRLSCYLVTWPMCIYIYMFIFFFQIWARSQSVGENITSLAWKKDGASCWQKMIIKINIKPIWLINWFSLMKCVYKWLDFRVNGYIKNEWTHSVKSYSDWFIPLIH